MLTPLEVHSKQFSTRFGRYDAREVDEFLDLVGQSYDQLYRESTELREKVKVLSEQQEHTDGISETLKQTLLTAQQAAEQTRRNAEEKAKLIVERAELQAAEAFDKMEDRVRTQEKRLADLTAQEGTVRARMKAILEAYLEMLDSSASDFGVRQAAATRE
ncbi:MAG: DivIVA domain-containing protein [Clostridia bacterium]|nr:DivIVA domain-containing protein [Clostridia bacterium]